MLAASSEMPLLALRQCRRRARSLMIASALALLLLLLFSGVASAHALLDHSDPPANASTSQCLTGSLPLLCVPEVLSEWLIYLATAVWVGGTFWLGYMAERAAQRDRSLVSTAIATSRRFRPIAATALVAFLVANVGYVMGQSMLADGSWASGFSPTLLSSTLLHSTFGVFWLVRTLLVLLALLLLVLFPDRSVAEEEWRPRLGLNFGRMALGLCLLVALAFSGHAAAAQVRGKIGPFAIPIDWLHLLSMSLWVGGLFFIALVLMPTIWADEPVKRGLALVKLLPRFSLIALASVFTAAVTGSLNADVQLNSWDQFLGTTYGRTLIIKILLFIVMMGISAYHAYRLRPQLSRELNAWSRLQASPGTPASSLAGVGSVALAPVPAEVRQEELATPSLQRRMSAALQMQSTEHQPLDDASSSPALATIERLSDLIRLWIRREAMLGAGVLLCAALLGGVAGSLAPALPGAPNINSPTLTATSKTPVNLAQTANGLRVTLKVSPDKFGTNSFGVLVQDASTGKPIVGANIHLVITMLDMDMGTGTSDLKGVGSGFYTGQGDLLMGGRWQVEVEVRAPQDPNTIQRFTFAFSVSFT